MAFGVVEIAAAARVVVTAIMAVVAVMLVITTGAVVTIQVAAYVTETELRRPGRYLPALPSHGTDRKLK